ncbi:aromatase/cyclase [Geodermatophilus sp. SYSU D01176]
MNQPGHRQVEHHIDVEASADRVFALIADVRQWPRIFPPTVHVDRVEQMGANERIQIWATANGAVKSWISRRVIDPGNLRINFRQEVSAPPVAAMGGTWLIEPCSDVASRVRLLHTYSAVGDDPDALAWIDRAVDHNSRAELAALKAGAESAAGEGHDLAFSFEDTVTIHGAVRDVYDFLYQAGMWQERLPHVSRVVLTEDTPGLQTLEMDTRTQDGATHTTKSIRACFPHAKIVYKQFALPALMRVHTGFWQLDDGEDGITATSQHFVEVNPDTIAVVLGPDAGPPEARAFIRSALGANSLATLRHARAYAESRR